MISVEPLEFNPVRGGRIRKGCTISDNLTGTIVYDDTWGDIPEDDMHLLSKVVLTQYRQNEGVTTMIDSILENKDGIEIGNNWYEFSEIESVIKEAIALQG